MQYLLMRGMIFNWEPIIKKTAFQIRELNVKNWLKENAGKESAIRNIQDKLLKQDVKKYLQDLKVYLEKKSEKEIINN